jgi:hypothetical protein
VGETLIGTLIDESLEPPRYISCHPKITNFELRNEARIDKLHKRHTASLAYVPGERWQTVLSAHLLGWGSGTLRLDEDAPATVAKAVVAAPKVSGTC